jgi:hypothetical protein
MPRVRKTAIGVAAVAVGVGGGYAIASVPDSNGVIHACVTKQVGSGLPATGGPNVRIIDSDAGPAAGQACDAASEFPLNWNQAGSPGPQGPAGPQGPQGPPGADGTTTTVLPAGHVDLKSVGSFDAWTLSLVEGKNVPPKVELSRSTDQLSPKLLQITLLGKSISTATIQFYKPGTTTVGSTVTMTNANITDFKTTGGGPYMVDELTLVATKLSVSSGILPQIKYVQPKKIKTL